MKNYRNQVGCNNCKHIFIYREYDRDDEYYCSFKAGKRPLCGSMAMDEDFPWDDRDKQNKWDDWAKGREVLREGLCDNHLRNEKGRILVDY